MDHKTVWWDGKDEKGAQVLSGVYFYRLGADKFSEVKKMMLVKQSGNSNNCLRIRFKSSPGKVSVRDLDPGRAFDFPG